MTLRDMTIGEVAWVAGFESGSRGYRRKLLAMGLTPGTTLTRHAPLGDPVEVRGFSLSLRREEAAVLRVERY